MSEDLTKKLTKGDQDTILTAIKNLDTYMRSSIDNLDTYMRSSVDNVVTWVSGVDSRLRRLEKTVEERLYDTRPIWHKVVADIAMLQTGQKHLVEVQEAMRTELSSVSRDQIVINDSIRKIQLDLHAIDDRLRRLEINDNHENSST